MDSYTLTCQARDRPTLSARCRELGLWDTMSCAGVGMEEQRAFRSRGHLGAGDMEEQGAWRSRGHGGAGGMEGAAGGMEGQGA